MRSFNRAWPIVLLLGLVLLFRLIPEIDLWFSGLFYDPEQGFYLKNALPERISYELFLDLPYLLLPLLLWLLFASWRWGSSRELPLRRGVLFLVVVLVLGPGLLVNALVKNNSGRARPVQVEQFGGERHFTPAFVVADQCEKNCSFVSGHAAMGFFFIAFAWVLKDRRWLLYGGLIGGLVGLGRIIQGAHFLSDVIFSFVLVLLTTMLCARWLLGRWGVRPA